VSASPSLSPSGLADRYPGDLDRLADGLTTKVTVASWHLGNHPHQDLLALRRWAYLLGLSQLER